MSLNVGLHDADKTGYPNLALMKLAAWHKAQGDTVSWFTPLFAHEYDRVYSSKVFTFSQEDPYLPAHTVRGGTGYGGDVALPPDVEHIAPDYSIYPSADFALGFLTRGCIRRCPWCVVPQKEGTIRGNAFYEEFARQDTSNIVFMDNNVLAHSHGLREIERLAASGLRVDFNQGLDARLIAADAGIAKMLAALHWFKPVRLACDHKDQMPHVRQAVEMLREAGCKPQRYSCYILVQDIQDALERVEFLRQIRVDPFAQPYRDFKSNARPTREQRRFARWVNHKAVFNSTAWEDYAA